MNDTARARELFGQWCDGQLSVQHITDNELSLPDAWMYQLNQHTTLGDSILYATASHALVLYLLKDRRVNIESKIRIFMVRWIKSWWSVKQLISIRNVCRNRDTDFVEQLGPVFGLPFELTPLGTAIREFRQDVVRLFLQWGCQLPLNEELPSWVWVIDEEVCVKRNRCRAAVIAFSIASRATLSKQTGWHDLCPMVMKMIWEKRFKNDWIYSFGRNPIWRSLCKI